MAMGLSGLTGGEDMRAAMSGLESEIKLWEANCETDFRRANLAKLAEIHTIIERIGAQLDRFRRIIKALNFLGISSRIESVRIGDAGRGFYTLADDTEKLVHNIDLAVSRIRGEASELAGVLELAQSETDQITCQLEESSSQAISNISRNIDAMAQVNEQARAVYEDVSATMKRAAAHIGNIVASLQFHDITRQQVEHVEETLTEARRILGEHLEIIEDDPEAEDDLQYVAWVRDLADLQRRQLEHSRNEFYRAVASLRENLVKIRADVEQVVGKALEFSRSGADGDQDALASIEQAAEEVVVILNDNLEKDRQVDEKLAAVAASISNMEQFLGDIEDIGADIQLIALNASVKAAKTGDMGRTLGVVAQEIQKLSANTSELTANLAAILRDVLGAADELSMSGGERLEESLGEAMERQRGYVRRLHELRREMHDAFARIEQGGDELEQAIAERAESLDIDATVGADLDRASEELGMIADEARELLPEGEVIDSAEHLQGLLRKYTMESERLVHMGLSSDAISASASAEEEGELDLWDDFEDFSSEAAAEPPRDEGSAPQDSGSEGSEEEEWENVELF